MVEPGFERGKSGCMVWAIKQCSNDFSSPSVWLFRMPRRCREWERGRSGTPFSRWQPGRQCHFSGGGGYKAGNDSGFWNHRKPVCAGAEWGMGQESAVSSPVGGFAWELSRVTAGTLYTALPNSSVPVRDTRHLLRSCLGNGTTRMSHRGHNFAVKEGST